MTMEKELLDDELIDNLLKDYKKPEDLIGENGLLKQLTKRLLERAMAYDGLNRVSGVTYSGESGYLTPAVTYTYDQSRSTFFNNGALTTVSTAASGDAPSTKTELDYDLMGRVSKHRQFIGTQQYDLEYGYNLAGQMTTEKYPSGKVVTNSFDANGRLANIADQARTYLSGLAYQGKGGSISTMNFGNGTSETFILNDRFQMTNQTLSKGSETVQKYDYGYGQIDGSGNLDTTKNNGQLSKIESFIGSNKQWTQKFNYDAIGRLKQSEEKRSDTNALTYKQTFDFDRFGNMYRKAANNGTLGQANPLAYTPIEDADITKSTNRLATYTTYDEAGNVTTDNKFRTMGFGYDANGRMVKATKANAPDALSVYDAAGMRVAEKVNDIWRFLIYDIGGKMVAEYGGLQANDEGGVKYLLSDWQGSTRTVLSNSGTVNGRSDYTAFGEEIAAGTGLRTTTQGFGSSSNPRQKYGLTERDDATGLDHTPWRKHENRAGRWSSPDPYNGSISQGDPQSFNRYAYVVGDPINFVDPSGLNAQSPGSHCTIRLADGTIINGKTDAWGGGNPDIGNVGTVTVYWSDYWAIIGHGQPDPFREGGGGLSEIGGGGGGTGVRLPFVSCGEFVNYLVRLMSRQGMTSAAQRGIRVGTQMMDTALKGYDGHINNGFKGFKQELVGSPNDPGRQGAGVYGHIFGQAGAYLAGRPVVAVGMMLADQFQFQFSRPQAQEEVTGNRLGRAAGRHMWNFLNGNGGQDQLRNSLMGDLCN